MVDSWSSIPWTAFPSEDSTSAKPKAFLKRKVPFKEDANALQTLDIWTLNSSDDSEASLDADALPRKSNGLWVIYIHGGAWRDPMVTAASFDNTVKHLLSREKALKNIAGFASLSYSLSPHPKHPEYPSPPTDPTKPADPSRLAKHPDHIRDILGALSYLQSKVSMGKDYVLGGHSCGATLAFQAAMQRSLWGKEAPDTSKCPKPRVILGLNGLYDLPDLIDNPGDKHKHLAELYEVFTRSAFGDNKAVWTLVSPTSEKEWKSSWPEGELAVFVQSLDDSLVPYRQTELMMDVVKESGVKSTEHEAGGDHNALWQEGGRLAEIIEDIVNKIK